MTVVWRDASLTGWGRALRASTKAARPERASELIEALDAAGPSLCLYGAGRSYGDAALNSGGATVIASRLDRVLSFDEETGEIEVEPGATIGGLLRDFGPRGWAPPVAPGTGFVTVAGAIANDIHGKNHRAEGSFGQRVTEITLRTGGGETLTLQPGDEAFRATVGGLGLTGAILSARLRMRPIAGGNALALTRRMPCLEAFIEAFMESDCYYSVGWVDATATGASLGRGILEEGESTDEPSRERVRRARAVPFDAPSFLFSAPVARAFNAAYYARIPKEGRTRIRPLSAFLFQLDVLDDWNRLYGKRGMHQFQCVVPLDATEALRAMLAEASSSDVDSPLAVFKRFGSGSAGMLSFPMEGWTLSLDFPATRASADLIGRLGAMALDAGGRVYMAKDALLPASAVPRMHPELDAFRAVCDRLDPEGRMTSDMARRLRIRRAADD